MQITVNIQTNKKTKNKITLRSENYEIRIVGQEAAQPATLIGSFEYTPKKVANSWKKKENYNQIHVNQHLCLPFCLLMFVKRTIYMFVCLSVCSICVPLISLIFILIFFLFIYFSKCFSTYVFSFSSLFWLLYNLVFLFPYSCSYHFFFCLYNYVFPLSIFMIFKFSIFFLFFFLFFFVFTFFL